MNKLITDIKAEEILDSRKNPTLKISVYVGDIVNSFSVPSGASTGTYEAYELRDETAGKSGVEKAISQVEQIIKPALIGIDVHDQSKIDSIMIEIDGTPQKKVLGGNSMIGVSIACAKTASLVDRIPVYEYLRTLSDIRPSRINPWLYFNLINGGKHAKSRLAFQEYHIVPQEVTISQNVKICEHIQSALDEIISEKYGQLPTKGDEGGIALDVEDVILPLKLLQESIQKCGYTDKILLALDVAASSFYDKNTKLYTFANKQFTSSELTEIYIKITNEFPIISIEDPFDEEDFEAFHNLKKILLQTIIIGDDLTVTNKDRLKEAVKQKSINGIIIKPNQIGTLTETLETMHYARLHDIECIVSHRSGETMDDFIADLAYAFGCFGIKSGALGPKERNAKYERLINISK